jgi:hypothetical protein
MNSKKGDLLLLPLGIGMSAPGDSLSEKCDPITLEEIRTLDRNNVDVFDRCATYNRSLKQETAAREK